MPDDSASGSHPSLSAGAHVGKHVREVVPNLAAAAEEAAQEVLTTGQFIGGVVLGEDQAVEMVVEVSRDTTERHRLEMQLRDADLRKTEFLAMLSHELRNPLAAIRNAVTFLQLHGPQDPVLEETRDVIVRQVNHLARLVDDLLDVSRVLCGKVQVQRQPFDLRDAVHQAVKTSRPLIDTGRHALQVKLPETRLEVLGDLTRLIQVVSKLLNNAAKYTDEEDAPEVRWA